MLGKVGWVKQWKKNEGKVCVNGEKWEAVSKVPLLQGDRVVIQKVEGPTLEHSIDKMRMERFEIS